jgi:hypothetical protein
MNNYIIFFSISIFVILLSLVIYFATRSTSNNTNVEPELNKTIKLQEISPQQAAYDLYVDQYVKPKAQEAMNTTYSSYIKQEAMNILKQTPEQQQATIQAALLASIKASRLVAEQELQKYAIENPNSLNGVKLIVLEDDMTALRIIEKQQQNNL